MVEYMENAKRKNYGKVAILMGGSSHEREISLISGNAILQSLLKNGIDAHAFDPAEQSAFDLKQQGFSRAVLATHGKGGEDGVLQGVLEYLQIPYTGSGVMASSLGMDKYRTKLVWGSFNIPMPNGVCLTSNTPQSIRANLSLPLIVKPVREGSTIGVTKVYRWEDLSQALDNAFKSDSLVLVEEMIEGSEFSITVCDGVVYPAVKIEAPSGDYDYQNKYFTDDTVYICPYEFDLDLDARIKGFALLGYQAVGARGVARLDFMMDKDNNPYFLEINTLPGMTNHSLVPLSYKAAGFSFDELCLQILDGAKLGD